MTAPPHDIYSSDTPPENYRGVRVRCGCCKVVVAICSPVNDFYSVPLYPHLVCLNCMVVINKKLEG